MIGQDVFALLVAQTWQVAVLAVFAWIAVRMFATDRPHLAHVIWALVLIKCMVPPVMSSPVSPFSWIEARSSQTQLTAQSSLQVKSNRERIQPPASVSAVLAIPNKTRAASLKSSSFKSLLPAQSKQPIESVGIPAAPIYETKFPTLVESAAISWPTVMVSLWLVGAAVGLILMTIRFTLFLFWLNKSPAVKNAQVEACVKKLRQQLRVRSSVRVKVSVRPVGPAVIGVIRPTILLPVAMIENKTDAEIEPLVAHELIHVRRGDLWWACCKRWLRVCFGFTHWFGSHQKCSRESRSVAAMRKR